MKALVCGASGFIGRRLVDRLKQEGYWVRAVSRSPARFSPSTADEFIVTDLRDNNSATDALNLRFGQFDEVYQCAAEIGGVGYLEDAATEIMRNNTLINVNVIHAAASVGIGKLFFPSSACVYKDMSEKDSAVDENAAYPALPSNQYGWEKLFAEQLISTYAKKHEFAVRIARLQTIYGPGNVWSGGREKAPLALCRKAIEAKNNEQIEVWGDGTAIRSFLYIDDAIEAIREFANSSLEGPVNIGSSEYVTIRELAETIVEISEKNLDLKFIPGPVGVKSRNFSNDKIHSLGWRPQISLRQGLSLTYDWLTRQYLDTPQRKVVGVF